MRLGRVALGLWVPLALIPGVYALAGHLTTLPAPAASDAKVGEGVTTLFPTLARSERAIHVLYERCGCSSRVATKIMAQGSRGPVREAVIMVDDDERGIDQSRLERLRSAGFLVAAMSTRAVAERLHVAAVPLLLIVDADDRVRYAGGYTVGRDSPQLEDRRILAEVSAGGSPSPLPVFGCAVATDLQRALDPLGLKY